MLWVKGRGGEIVEERGAETRRGRRRRIKEMEYLHRQRERASLEEMEINTRINTS